MGRAIAGIFLAMGLLPLAARAQEARVVDAFEDVSAWRAAPSDGVTLDIGQGAGVEGRAMRLDFDFQGRGGWASAVRPVDLELPENYVLTFHIRGDAPVNNLEVKLVSDDGQNVWWAPQRDYTFPDDWTRVRLKKRHIVFAWGPDGEKPLRNVSSIEFTVSAGEGGRGTVLIDELTLAPRPPDRPYDGVPALSASSFAGDDVAARALDGDPATVWRSSPQDAGQNVLVDFGRLREYGGLVLQWGADDYATDYDVQLSEDGAAWETVFTVEGGDGGRDYVYLPEAESRYVRLDLRRSARGRGYALAEVDVRPLAFSASPNAFFEAVAADAPAGRYPRYLGMEQSYWTVVGVDGDTEEAMMNADGLLEVGKRMFSIEPFVWTDGRLVTWHDVEAEPSLARGHLPVPTVRWTDAPVELAATAFALGEPGAAVLFARYRLSNAGAARRQGRLYLALRPFQVNPSWQFLNTPGGAAPVREIAYDGTVVRVNGGEREIHPVHPAPEAFGAAPFASGNVVAALAGGRLPEATDVRDPFGYASGALAYPFDLAPGEATDVLVAVPLHAGASPAAFGTGADAAARLQAEAEAAWVERLSRVEIDLPGEARHLADVVRSNLAYVLVNRDGAGIQPGSRSYERSWIRDGSLTSSALLRLGHAEAVRDFAEWFAPYQFDSGKVPCCVDARGAGAVPEHDSHGELIYLVAEYYRFTRDAGFVAKLWPHVEAAVDYIAFLRHQRTTAEYRTPEKAAYYGLVPESISHEGYSARPVHSYWDAFFTLRGLKDAAFLAGVMGDDEAGGRYAALRDSFAHDLHASFRRTMAMHEIDYLPGSVELGDFDATSTTVGLDPGGEQSRLPDTALVRTFERYYDFFRDRRDGRLEWEAYTPYELRVVGTFVRLGWKDRAHELLDFFLGDRRPAGWNHWAEVVWRDPAAPRFIGDMPHTWVGSDFIRSFLSFFAYEREEDAALVLAAGVPEAWADAPEGVTVKRLPTYHGPLHLSIRPAADGALRVRLGGDLTVPPGGFVLRSPRSAPLRAVTVDGLPVDTFTAAEVVLRTVPADVVLHY